MSISNISPVIQPANIQNWQASMSQRQQDFQSLASSLQAGNLSGAQQAYSELQTIASGAVSGAASGTNPGQKEFALLGQDLSAGNLSQAQKDFAQMKTDFQSVLSENGAVHGLHHHGHHGYKMGGSSSDGDSATSTTDPILSNATSSLLSQYTSTNAANDSTAASVLSLIG